MTDCSREYIRQYKGIYAAFRGCGEGVDPKWEPGKPIPSGPLDGIKGSH